MFVHTSLIIGSQCCRETWPQNLVTLDGSGAREAYLERRTATRQFKFDDPLTFNIPACASPQSHLMFDNDDIVLAQVTLQNFWHDINMQMTRSNVVIFEEFHGNQTCQ